MCIKLTILVFVRRSYQVFRNQLGRRILSSGIFRFQIKSFDMTSTRTRTVQCVARSHPTIHIEAPRRRKKKPRNCIQSSQRGGMSDACVCAVATAIQTINKNSKIALVRAQTPASLCIVCIHWQHPDPSDRICFEQHFQIDAFRWLFRCFKRTYDFICEVPAIALRSTVLKIPQFENFHLFEIARESFGKFCVFSGGIGRGSWQFGTFSSTFR